MRATSIKWIWIFYLWRSLDDYVRDTFGCLCKHPLNDNIHLSLDTIMIVMVAKFRCICLCRIPGFGDSVVWMEHLLPQTLYTDWKNHFLSFLLVTIIHWLFTWPLLCQSCWSIFVIVNVWPNLAQSLLEWVGKNKANLISICHPPSHFIIWLNIRCHFLFRSFLLQVSSFRSNQNVYPPHQQHTHTTIVCFHFPVWALLSFSRDRLPYSLSCLLHCVQHNKPISSSGLLFSLFLLSWSFFTFRTTPMNRNGDMQFMCVLKGISFLYRLLVATQSVSNVFVF